VPPRELGPLLLASVLSTASVEVAAASQLRFVDDLGRPITAGLEVCFQIATRSECTRSQEGSPVAVPPDFDTLRVEGEDHGPVSARRSGMAGKGKDGPPTLTVPRKARLEFAAPPEEKIKVSVYSQDDPTFRIPSFRGEARGGSFVKIPAGRHLISLTASDKAPDLHLLTAEPGGRHRLAWTARPGWSLVLRFRSADDDAPVEKAAVRLEGSEGFSAPGQGTLRGTSASGGLALFSGVPHVLASVSTDHPRFVLSREEGFSASPGTFAFREILLERGGSLKARVTLEGRPAAGATCQVLEYESNPYGPAPEPKVHFEAAVGRDGLCRSGRLAAGPYTLRLTPPGSPSRVDRSVIIVNGQETTVDVALVPIRVHGEVTRGTEPAAGFVLMFSEMAEIKPNATRRDQLAEAVTDEKGLYEATLWAPSEYAVLLDTPAGTPAAWKRLRLASEEERVDFHLEPQEVVGRVVDEHDRPVPEASVAFRLNGSVRRAVTDEQGAFSFPLPDTGTGQVQAGKPGFLSPEPAEVTVLPDVPLQPVVLRLRRTGLLAGRVLAAGRPVVGAGLTSYRVESGESMTRLGSVVTDQEGRFEIPASGGAPVRIFVTGSGCPLTPFELVVSEQEAVLQCPPLPASLELQFQDQQGLPMAGRTVVGRHNGKVIPNEVLITHLSRFRLPAASDGAGRLLLVGLTPGSYDLYLAEATNPELIAMGAPHGFLASASLAPFTTTELQVTVEAESAR
jgi:hypothetical protein